MRRCIELALLGAGQVAPNPMVGAVLVYEDKIIGEGFHHQYGQPHAEVNCINSVTAADRHLIPLSSLYVSLEPCAHAGKTPPCSEFIIEKGIQIVFIGCRDPFEQVNGKGIEQLKNAGIQVFTGVLEDECAALNTRFFTFHTKQRPYIILKWAQTANGKIGSDLQERLMISNRHTNRIVHQWRSEEASILIGTNTALLDDPSLDNRLWTGKSPVRMVLDLPLRLPKSLKIFNQQQRTIIFNRVIQKEENNICYYQLKAQSHIIQEVLNACFVLNLQSVIVEGGAKLLQSFINDDIWDEARVIVNNEMTITKGLHAPVLPEIQPAKIEKIFSDTIHYYTNKTKSINQ